MTRKKIEPKSSNCEPNAITPTPLRQLFFIIYYFISIENCFSKNFTIFYIHWYCNALAETKNNNNKRNKKQNIVTTIIKHNLRNNCNKQQKQY